MEFRATAAAFSEKLGWIKTEDNLLLLDGRERVLDARKAPGSTAVFAFSEDGKRAVAFVVETHELVVWAPAAMESEPDESADRRFRPHVQPRPNPRVLLLDPALISGSIVAMSFAGADQVRLVTRRGETVWSLIVSLSTGAVGEETVLDGVSTPLLVLPDGRLLFAGESDIVIRNPRGAEVRLPTGGPVEAFELMSDDWVQVVMNDHERFALNATADRPALFRLPEARP
jgi:hypothetical protein